MIIEEPQQFPDVLDVRKRIEEIRDRRIRLPLMCQYLIGGRVSEVCGKYALFRKSLQVNTWQRPLTGEIEPILVITVRTAKTDGLFRACALPMNTKYEPWTQEIYQYSMARPDERPLFKFGTRTMQIHAKDAFSGINYPIEKYKEAERHWRQISTHGLRHIRATELSMYYGFDGTDLAIFCGWRDKSMPQMANRYIYQQWSRYVEKLFKPRPRQVLTPSPGPL